MFRKVLVPLDGSYLSEMALEQALAVVSGCEVPEMVILTVVEPFHDQPYRTGDDWIEKIQKQAVRVAQNYVNQLVERLKSTGRQVEAVVIKGNPAQVILEYAQKKSIDLIIMSAYGRSGISRWPFGSVTDKVVRHSPVPVLVTSPSFPGTGQPGRLAQVDQIREGKKEIQMYKKILVPLDGSPNSECVLDHVKSVATGCHVPEVMLLSVVEPLRLGYYGITEDMIQETLRKGAESARDMVSRSAERLKREGVYTTASVEQGKAADTILDFAKSSGADLIIMSTHGRSGITRWALGSVADRVAHHSPIPVMLISPPGCRIGEAT
jgi:nucleotide-binding universal stress UspA family protein